MTPKLTRLSANLAVAAAIVCMGMLMQAETSVSDRDRAIILNNDGVKALNAGNFNLAIQRFEEALKVSPEYDLARENLAIVRREHGQSLDNESKMWELRREVFFGVTDHTSLGKLEMLIKLSGREPKSFEDRIALAQECLNKADYIGAYVECLEALKLRKNDARTRKSLAEIIHLLDKPGLASCVEIAKKKAAPFLDQPAEPDSYRLMPDNGTRQ
ncbi:MAG: hypothetical protein C0469_07570 [Cyanobacteria bacterium DS2.3.42]|nr:hypothetical protein [Cyanobacteria bacterium DS2.3.42]